MRKWVGNVTGWIVGIGSYAVVTQLLPTALGCADGWPSRSIGRMGACSWHGGVSDYRWLYALTALVSAVVGMTVAYRIRGED